MEGRALVISYVTIGVDDIPRAMTFYDAALAALGHKRIYARDDWLGYCLADGAYTPRIWIFQPENSEAATFGNGSMVGLHAPSTADVDRFHAVALASGGRDEGPPGRRDHYNPGDYLAYVRDRAGNKLSAFCTTDLIKSDGTCDPQPISAPPSS
jgi:catechol 2,3-dioxygenase-like lactoylglutathione lyase family enzyme